MSRVHFTRGDDDKFLGVGHSVRMKLTHSVRYDATVEDVYAMLTDPAFRQAAVDAQGAISSSISVDGTAVRISMETPNNDIPSFARKFVGETVRADQSEDWSDDAYEADFTVVPKGAPGHIVGRRSLLEDGTGCLDTFVGEAKASIPLIGGKLEKLIGDKLKEGWDVEHGVGVRWLAGDR